MKYKIKIIYPSAPEKYKKIVYNIRYQAYVIDKGLPFYDNNNELKDEQDEYHPSLLLFINNVPVATIRMEIKSLGPLSEINNWNLNNINSNFLVFNRFAILKKYRKLNLLPYFLAYGFKIGIDKKYNIENVFFASNVPKLIKIYKMFGKIYEPCPKKIKILGIERDNYILLRTYLGKNNSIKRKLSYIIFNIYPYYFKLKKI